MIAHRTQPRLFFRSMVSGRRFGHHRVGERPEAVVLTRSGGFVAVPRAVEQVGGVGELGRGDGRGRSQLAAFLAGRTARDLVEQAASGEIADQGAVAAAQRVAEATVARVLVGLGAPVGRLTAAIDDHVSRHHLGDRSPPDAHDDQRDDTRDDEGEDRPRDQRPAPTPAEGTEQLLDELARSLSPSQLSARRTGFSAGGLNSCGQDLVGGIAPPDVGRARIGRREISAREPHRRRDRCAPPAGRDLRCGSADRDRRTPRWRRRSGS